MLLAAVNSAPGQHTAVFLALLPLSAILQAVHGLTAVSVKMQNMRS